MAAVEEPTTEVVTVDTLEQQALALVSEAGVRFGRLLPVLRELDASQVATGDGCRTLAEWVASRLDVTHDTARDLVHLARAADADVEADLVAGRVSWERAVATIRLKTAGAPEQVVSRSVGFDLAGVERLTSLYRRVTVADEQGTDRYLVVQPSLGEGNWRLWGQVPATDGQVIEQALLSRADDLPELSAGDEEAVRVGPNALVEPVHVGAGPLRRADGVPAQLPEERELLEVLLEDVAQQDDLRRDHRVALS